MHRIEGDSWEDVPRFSSGGTPSLPNDVIESKSHGFCAIVWQSSVRRHTPARSGSRSRASRYSFRSAHIARVPLLATLGRSTRVEHRTHKQSGQTCVRVRLETRKVDAVVLVLKLVLEAQTRRAWRTVGRERHVVPHVCAAMNPADAVRPGVHVRVHHRLEAAAKERAALGEVRERKLVRDAGFAVPDFKVEPLAIGAVLDVGMDRELVLLS